MSNGICGRLAPLIKGGDLIKTLNHVTTLNNNQSENEEVLLVCGSFYIMEDVRKYFFRQENTNADPAAVNSV